MKETILVVEDNRVIARLLKKNIRDYLGYNVAIASTFQEAKSLIKSNLEFLLSVCDLNLPDAPDGEVVNYALGKDVPVIVLTGSTDCNKREKFTHKSIIDFVNKERVEDLGYIVDRIREFARNRKYKILVVDDSKTQRFMAREYLIVQNYEVLLAEDGVDALRIINENQDIKAVITDYNMPNMNGLDLILAIRKEYPKEKMAIIAISATGEPKILAQLLKLGANDFLHKPYTKEEFDCRINNSINYLDNFERMINLANRDFLTGLFNRRIFFEKAEEYILSLKTNEKYGVLMVDIDLFKQVNDTYGHDTGDITLSSVSKSILESTRGADIVSRFGGEEFCVILKNIDKTGILMVAENVRKNVESCNMLTLTSGRFSVTVSIGACLNRENLDDGIKEADRLLYVAKERGRNRVEIELEILI